MTIFEMRKDLLLLRIHKKGRQPHLNQLFAYAATISSHVEQNQIILDVIINQLQSGNGIFCS